MCGLYASIAFAPDKRRIDIVAHRGPDGDGWREYETPWGPLALGHRRLAIIDLDERAIQPMQIEDGRYWLVFNGEIYNYLEIRAELQGLGRTFRTESDAEVLLTAYAEWGEAALAKLIGMFAFLIWDAREKTLFAARDRFGIKPLFYVANEHGAAFGSEIKQLLDLPGVSRRMNLPRVYDFLSTGITDHMAETLFADVRQLRGGECVRLDAKSWRHGQPLPIKRYYDLRNRPRVTLGETEAGEQFRRLLDDSVRLHLRSDVRVGSCLSGGLDSSSIVSLMARKHTGAETIQTVSACYAEKEADERSFVEAVVAQSGVNPHYVYPRAEDALAKAETITWHQDEPYGSTSIFAQWSVFEEAKRQRIKVMLDGQGADEQLAGYHSSFFQHFDALVRQARWAEITRTMIERKNFHGVPVTSQFAAHVLPRMPAPVRRTLEPLRRARPMPTENWIDSDLLAPHRPARGATFEQALADDDLGAINDIGDLCVALTASTNLPMLLRYEDRNSMAHSIEARVPFLDHRLVEFSLALGDQHKIVGGDTKRVLRVAMAGILPESIRQRRDKLGFATPEQTWFRGPLRGAVEAGLETTLGLYPGLLRAANVRTYAADVLDGRRPLDFALWRIISLGVWGKVFRVTL